MTAETVDRRLLRRGVEEVVLVGQREMGQIGEGRLEKLVTLLEQVGHHEHLDGINAERRERGAVRPPPMPTGAGSDGR